MFLGGVVVFVAKYTLRANMETNQYLNIAAIRHHI